MDIDVLRSLADLNGVNVLTLATIPLRFQIAPGAANRLGVANLDFTISVDGNELSSGTTDSNGELTVPLLALLVARPILHILGTDYSLRLHPDLEAISDIDGQQIRFAQLGYMMGHQLTDVDNDVADDDGEDGPRTQQAIMNFQMDKGLSVDGIVGPNTTNKLKTEVGGV
jgi:peptidoglycan hydrolase-like protein with peptidoglycan-binding domain